MFSSGFSGWSMAYPAMIDFLVFSRTLIRRGSGFLVEADHVLEQAFGDDDEEKDRNAKQVETGRIEP